MMQIHYFISREYSRCWSLLLPVIHHRHCLTSDNTVPWHLRVVIQGVWFPGWCVSGWDRVQTAPAGSCPQTSARGNPLCWGAPYVPAPGPHSGPAPAIPASLEREQMRTPPPHWQGRQPALSACGGAGWHAASQRPFAKPVPVARCWWLCKASLPVVGNC